jgi:Cellulase (glycosyl hydrolase family 5)
MRRSHFNKVLALVLVVGAFSPFATSANALPSITARGTDLSANGSRWIGYGANYGIGEITPYSGFDEAQWTHDFDVAQDLGFNSLRVYLPLFHYVERNPQGKLQAVQTHLADLTTILQMAESRGIYLDLTGNLVWHGADEAPDWYDAMGYADRWNVQQFFWRQISKTAAPSSAVLMYELTSEPTIGGSSWYTCPFAGWVFCPNLATNVSGSTAAALAQQWTKKMANAVRVYDKRHIISIGMLPAKGGPLGPANVGRYLDAITFHEFPITGGADSSISTAQWFASWNKPTILGETFMLRDDADTHQQFLLGIKPYVDSYMTFFDGLPLEEQSDPYRRADLDLFVSLREQLLTP